MVVFTTSDNPIQTEFKPKGQLGYAAGRKIKAQLNGADTVANASFSRDTSQRPSTSLMENIPARSVAFHLLSRVRDVEVLLSSIVPAMLIIEIEGNDSKARDSIVKEILRKVRDGNTGKSKRCFVALWSKCISEDPVERTFWNKIGVNMITHRLSSIIEALSIIQEHAGVALSARTSRPSTASTISLSSGNQEFNTSSSHHPISCPFCGLALKWKYLYVHLALIHCKEVAEDETSGGPTTCCFICREPGVRLLKHIKNAHCPFQHHYASSGSNRTSESLRSSNVSLSSIGRSSIVSGTGSLGRGAMPVFVLVVVRRTGDDHFLLKDEIASQGWWLPGGAVARGEDLVLAAERQTMDETGIKIIVKGLLRFEYTPSPHGFRLRVVFYAEPVDATEIPKTLPDYASNAACWVSLDLLLHRPSRKQGRTRLFLRGPEPVIWCSYIAAGGSVWPLSILAGEKDQVLWGGDGGHMAGVRLVKRKSLKRDVRNDTAGNEVLRQEVVGKGQTEEEETEEDDVSKGEENEVDENKRENNEESKESDQQQKIPSASNGTESESEEINTLKIRDMEISQDLKITQDNSKLVGVADELELILKPSAVTKVARFSDNSLESFYN